MGMTYDSALITTAAEVAHLTGRQGLGNLENAGFTLATHLLEAHRWVYERVYGRWGKDLSTITNQTHLRRAVAHKAVHDLAAAGLIKLADGLAPDHYLTEAKDQADNFRPEWAAAEAGRVASEDLPRMANFEDGLWHQGSSGPAVPYRRTPRRSGS